MILVMCVGGCLFTTATVSLAQSDSISFNAEQAQAEAIRFLADLVRIDTQDPPSKVAHYLEGVLKSEGIESEILESVPGRASIVARLKGNGKKRPLLIMGHEDVVPVDRSHWTVDPFAAGELRTTSPKIAYPIDSSSNSYEPTSSSRIQLQNWRAILPVGRRLHGLTSATTFNPR
jgi:hypothetical protein